MYGKNSESYFSKTIAAFDFKVGCYTELNDLMKLHEYQNQGHYLTFRKRSLHFQTYFLFFSKTVGLFETKYHVKAFGSSERKKYTTGLGHMTKMVPRQYVVNTFKNFSRANRVIGLVPWCAPAARGYQKVLSLTWKEPEIWIYSALFFNVVPFQLHTLVPSSFPVINTRSGEVNILVP